MLSIENPHRADQPTKIPRSFLAKILSNLTFWVLMAIIAGVILGSCAPETAVKMEIIGKTFIDIIKLFIAPIIFFNDCSWHQWDG